MTECSFCAGSGCSSCHQTGHKDITYQIGALLDFRSSDIEVAGLPAAHLQAGKLMDTNWNTPVGIWTGQ